MQHPDPNILMTIAILVTVFTFGAVIAISVTWLQSRSKIKAIEVLKAYAERGEEPPPAVADALARINWPFGAASGPPVPQPATRSVHLQHFAGSVVLTLGALAVIWWQAPAPREHPGWLMVTAIFVAVFFAAAAAARAVAAVTTPDGDR